MLALGDLRRSRGLAPACAAPLARLLAVLAGDLAWQATHQDQPLRWLTASQVAPAPSGSAAFLLARQRAEGPFRFATAAPEPVLVHQLGAHRSAWARALLLDQEALRLGLEDVAGYNPVHLKRYNRLMLASNGGRDGRSPLRARAALRHAAAALARRALLRLAPGRAAAGPARRLPRPPQRGHARRRGAAVRAHRAAGRAPQAARVVSREPDRIVIAPPGARAPGRGRPRLPRLEGRDRRRPAHALGDGDLRAVQVPAAAEARLDVHAARRCAWAR